MKQRKRDPGGEGSQHSQTASHEQGTDQRGGFEALRLARQGAREQGDSDRFW
ncbi:MAG TPA: hypothetical protein VFV38_22600 [Ktedonobacteraceae bacterium]|nr:hypothetical protein [Ktedonobacteraceae bacterium]